MRVFWQAGRNQRKYAIFSATVIASATDQESDFQEKAKQKLTYIPIIEPSDIPTTGTDEPPPDQGDLSLGESRSGRVSGASEPLTGYNDWQGGCDHAVSATTC